MGATAMTRSTEAVKADLRATLKQRDDAVKTIRHSMQVAASSNDRIDRLLNELFRSMVEAEMAIFADLPTTPTTTPSVPAKRS
jgi:hypothetical protein